MNKLLAETAGTFAVVLAGSTAILLAERQPAWMPSAGVAVVWGAAVCLVILTVGSVSGAHLNPAVSLAFTVLKRLPVSHLGVYWAGQLSGGVLAVLALKFASERI